MKPLSLPVCDCHPQRSLFRLPKQFTVAPLIMVAALYLSGCTAPLIQRVTHETKGVQLGVESDLSTTETAVPPILNAHPAKLTAEEVRTLLGAIEVSGWSGIVVGVFDNPRPVPVFAGSELTALAEPFARAFAEAGPKERVFFSLQNPSARYDTDRTAGSMFIRDGVLHFILVDHYIFQQADPGGGERRDPRDTKGMKLWIVRPAQAASLLEGQEPRWSTFEKVHVSMRVRDVLAALQPSSVPAKPDIAAPASPPASPAPTSPVGASAPASRDGGLNVQQKVSDLDMANQKLRTQLEQQTSELDKLKNELRQLREELKASKGSVKSPTRKPAVKPSAE
ncbi:MAG: hypothetical protein KF814_13270 [Nitrospiraceae bacterium]|nr:hypothetical protein [Nitrospiraceae bacterium]